MPAANEPHRKLAAILSADAVGYSRLMQADEAATVETLNAYRAAMRRVIERHNGRVVNAPGDALLAEFASVVEAVSAAVEIQHSLEGRNMELPPERRMHFRIGVNLGDVIEQEDGTIYGDGVNIAARMEALAEGGGVCVSSPVFDAVEGKLALGFDFLGEQQVKNIAKPVRVYRVRTERREEKPPAKAARQRRWLWPATAGMVVLGALLGVGLWRYGYLPRQAPADPILAVPKGPSLAVLPFTNLTGDPNQDYFSDGLTEQIITALARYRALYVIARNSTFQYKGQSVDVRKVGHELGARFVLEGSVSRSGKTIRVTAQLLDARSGAHLWAETYDRVLTGTDIFALQDDITSNAVANIAGPHGRIAQTDLKEAKGKGPESMDSYECVLRAANYARNDQSLEGHAPLRDCLERAVARDPQYAEAWAWLAYAYLLEYESGYNPRPESYNALDKALHTALRAVDLDPNSAVAHTNLCFVRFIRHEVDASLASGERALELNPNDPEVLCNVGQYIAYAGNWERGLALTKKAIALGPHPGWCHFQLAVHHYLQRDYERALSETLKVEMPGYVWTDAHLAVDYAQLGRKEEAKAAVARLLKLDPNFSSNVRPGFRKYNFKEEWIEAFVDGLRKAGLNVPPE